MPTITAQLFDMGRLVGEPLSAETLEDALPLVKGELKSHDAFTGELRIELADGNRPDLWSPEGVARQLRAVREGKGKTYSFFSKRKRKNVGRIEVAPELETIRPYIAGFSARNLKVGEDGLVGMIEAQEKLSEVFGRRRKSIAIGIYNAGRISWPVRYLAVRPGDRRFTPLGAEEEMDLAAILFDHPKGVQYAGLLQGFSRYPFLEDAEGRVLSFPPVINSSDVGLVEVGDNHLFVEVTGTDLDTVLLAANIFAVNLADRGGRIVPCDVIYPYDTPRGRTVRCPHDIATEIEVPFAEFERVLGITAGREDVKSVLSRFGVRVRTKGSSAFVTPPPYRRDYIHPFDAVEDFAVSYGYESFPLDTLTSFTPGELDPLTVFADRAREILTGLGFEELVSNVLTSPAFVREHMRLSARGDLVEIENVYAETYSVVRDRILPSLLEAEAESVKAMYPHLLFEEGECARKANGKVISERRLGGAIAHAEANFSEAHGRLNLLLYYLDVDASVEPVDHPAYLEGRCGNIVAGGKAVGVIGEVHPAVLEAWGVKMPVAAFELNLSALCETRALS